MEKDLVFGRFWLRQNYIYTVVYQLWKHKVLYLLGSDYMLLDHQFDLRHFGLQITLPNPHKPLLQGILLLPALQTPEPVPAFHRQHKGSNMHLPSIEKFE